MESPFLSNFLIAIDSKRKLPTPIGETLYPFLSLTTSSRFGALLTRSDTYFGFTATFRRSVKDAEFSQSRIMWLTIWSRFLLEKKSQISLSESRSASESLSFFITTEKWIRCYLKLMLLNYHLLS